MSQLPRRKLTLTLTLFSVLLAFRVASIFLIEPLNAPDEAGHMILVTAMSNGTLLSLDEELKYQPRYPYAMFSQVPYLPYAASLAIAGVFAPELKQLDFPAPTFTPAAVYAARIGGLAWFALFFVYLLKLIQGLAVRYQVLTVILIGLLPQLIFTHSYVTLDAMGTGVMPYLIWSMREKKWRHAAFAVALVLTSKLNFLCLLALPVWLLWEWYRQDRGQMVRCVLQVLVIPAICVAPMFAFNYWRNTSQFGSFVGYSALQTLYPFPPGGWGIFSYNFVGLSLNSALGVFGYFTDALPAPFFWIWKGLFLPIAGVIMLWALAKRRPIPAWHRAFFALFCVNWFLHFAASFRDAPSPQGRYLFPAIFILMGYLVFGCMSARTRWLGTAKTKALSFAEAAVATFMVSSAVCGLYYCSLPGP